MRMITSWLLSPLIHSPIVSIQSPMFPLNPVTHLSFTLIHSIDFPHSFHWSVTLIPHWLSIQKVITGFDQNPPIPSLSLFRLELTANCFQSGGHWPLNWLSWLLLLIKVADLEIFRVLTGIDLQTCFSCFSRPLLTFRASHCVIWLSDWTQSSDTQNSTKD